jgi:hypothetical protein
MNTNEHSRHFTSSTITLALSLFIAALAVAADPGCTRDMVVGNALGEEGTRGTGGSAVTTASGGSTGSGGAGGSDAGTFACGSQTCVVGRDFCLGGPTDTGHCAPLPGACASVASCGCVCATASGGPGICTEPARFNHGLDQCSCQGIGATANVQVWCSPPPDTSDGGGATGGAGGADGTGGAGGAPSFPCGSGTCAVGAELCLMAPGYTRCMSFPQPGTACASRDSACGCACGTASGGPGLCPDPALINQGGRQCSCQYMGASANAVVSCQ